MAESFTGFTGEGVIRPISRTVEAAADTFVSKDGVIVSNRFASPPHAFFGHPIYTSVEDAVASDRLMQNIYGDLYHTDYSAVSGVHAKELIVRLPAQLHLKMRDFMGATDRAGWRDPGIWVGDADTLDLGHRYMNRHNWPVMALMSLGGNESKRIAGIYLDDHRALLHGNGYTRKYSNSILHEFGHATDDLMSRMSADRDNYIKRVHIPAMRDIIENGSPQAGKAIDRWIERPHETWAEGFAWYYDDYGDTFFDSPKATRLMSEYFSEVDSAIRS